MRREVGTARGRYRALSRPAPSPFRRALAHLGGRGAGRSTAYRKDHRPPMGDTLVAYAHTNDVTHSWAQSMHRLILHDQGRLIGPISDVRCSSGNLEHARNAMMAELLEGDCEWLFIVDTDMGFQANGLEMLRAVADPT